MLLPLVRPRLIALDMDGTLCDSANVIPDENLRALRICHRSGIHLAVLTGLRRSTLAAKLDEIYAACEPQAAGSPETAPRWLAATNSGGLIWEYPGWRQLSAICMPPGLTAAVADALAPHSLNVHVNPSTCAGTELLHLRREPSATLDRYFLHFGQETQLVDTPADLLKFEITMFAVPAPLELVRELAARLRARFSPGELTVLSMRWPLLDTWALEAYAPELHKAAALSAIAQRLGIPRQLVAAAGDDLNDIPMLRWAGHSAVLPHAPDEVVAAADLVLGGEGAGALAPWLEALAGLPPVAA